MTAFALTLVAALFCGAHATFKLRMLDTEYIPKSYNPETYEYNVGASEQVDLDDIIPGIAYITGRNNLQVIDFTDPTNLKNVYNIPMGADETVEATDVDACDNFVAVSIDDFDNKLEGRVRIYTSYDATAEPPISLVTEITVGSLPDMLIFTSDCSRLLVAIEGELFEADGEVVDPEGEVVIIDFENGTPGPAFSTSRADFRAYNDREAEYVQKGVRKIYNGQNSDLGSTTFAQDMEPEYIQINADDTIAYVVLQDNDAVAVVDIATATVTEIYALGDKEWSTSALDASDVDGAARLNPYPIKGIRNPDNMALITIGGEDYMLTANEGDEKVYSFWSESKRANEFGDDEFDDSISQDIRDAMSDDTLLGRLSVSTVDGLTEAGQYDAFYSYGSRDFSLFKCSNFTEVYNSGNEFETILASEYESIFNSDPSSNSQSPEEAFDTRSDNRGPEPESITYGVINGQTVVFIGFERPGQLVLYSMDDSGATPTFNYESMNYYGGFGASWEDLYDQRATSDTGPEDLRFVPASKSVTGVPLLLSASTYSGTLSVFEVIEE